MDQPPDRSHAPAHRRVGRRRLIQGAGGVAAAAGFWGVFGTGPVDSRASRGTNGTAITVAAVDSPAELAANANFVCRGSDDDTTINGAIAALGGQGEVVLLPGTFHLGSSGDSAIQLSNQYGGLRLSGSGNGTVISIPAGSQAPAAVVMASWAGATQALTDVTIVGPDAGSGDCHGVWSQCNGAVIENVRVMLAPGHGFLLDGCPASEGAAASNTAFNAQVTNCFAQACGQGILAGGARGDGFHVTALCENVLFSACIVNGGSGNGAALVSQDLEAGQTLTSIPLAGDGVWQDLSADHGLVILYATGLDDVDALGRDIGYRTVTTRGAGAGARALGVAGFQPGETYAGLQTVVLDPSATTTGVGFFTRGASCHYDDCHAYFCWVGHYSDGTATYIQGGEYESCAAVNVLARLATHPGDTPFQLIGANSYGNPVVACIQITGGADGVQIADCYVSAAESQYGIWGVGGSNHTIQGNVIRDGLGPGRNLAGSASIAYVDGSGHLLHANLVMLSSDVAGELTMPHSGISVTNCTDTLITDNNLSASVATQSTPLYVSGVTTGTVVRGNLGHNPVGNRIVAVPPSGEAVAADAVDRTFYISTGTGSTTVMVSGDAALELPAQTLVTVRVPAGTQLTPTYQSAPAWVVSGE